MRKTRQSFLKKLEFLSLVSQRFAEFSTYPCLWRQKYLYLHQECCSFYDLDFISLSLALPFGFLIPSEFLDATHLSSWFITSVFLNRLAPLGMGKVKEVSRLHQHFLRIRAGVCSGQQVVVISTDFRQALKGGPRFETWTRYSTSWPSVSSSVNIYKFL